MLDPEKDNMILDAPLYELIDEFICKICQYVVKPYPDECPQCNKLYCGECVRKRGYWQCPNMNCNSSRQPVPMHRGVK